MTDASADRERKMIELNELKTRVASLEADIARMEAKRADWAPEGYYTTYHIIAGMTLGFIAALASLMFNVVMAPIFGEDSLQLIRVYLTFPLGEKALSFTADKDGFVLAAGCGLYLLTGMFGGIPFHMILSRFFADDSFIKRFIVATVLALGVWVINFYGIIRWAQPALIGGNWIVEKTPLLVQISTHLVFGWTMLLVAQWGRFIPPKKSSLESAK